MTRVKRGKTATKKRENLLKHVKGFKWGRKSKERAAREALLHAYKHAYRGRKEKKREFRRLWQVKINAAVREHGLRYSEFIHLLKKNKIEINRKIFAEIAEDQPEIFSRIIEQIKSKQRV